jgi:hypothetical protein
VSGDAEANDLALVGSYSSVYSSAHSSLRHRLARKAQDHCRKPEGHRETSLKSHLLSRHRHELSSERIRFTYVFGFFLWLKRTLTRKSHEE